MPKFVKTAQQNSLFLHFFKNFRSSKSCLIRFGIRFPVICFEKLINFELFSQVIIKIKELDYLLKNQQFLINYIKKFNNMIKKVVEMLLVLIFSLLIFKLAIFSYFYSKKLCDYFLRLLLCVVLLIWKI